VVAEGIETDAQLQALKSLGCERGQGYLLARPMNNTELRDFFLERTAIAMPPADIDDVSVVSVLQ
jgi:EAL domain-containing protein (putative c-di-GMP-specific phosphodiesterase class I)